MNKVDYLQTEGFPLDTNTLDFFQSAYKELQAMTAFGGNNIIVSGCIVAGSNTSDGYVVINNELLPFKGGLNQANIVIREEKELAQFQGGGFKEVYVTRDATFGSGAGSIPFSSLTRLTDLKSLATVEARLVKLEKIAAPFTVAGGSMVFWRKPANTIPAGWREVVDWRGRMPVGWKPDDPDFNVIGALGDTGGSKTHQMTIPQVPPHDHDTEDTQPDGGTDFGNGSTRFSYTSVKTVTKKTAKTGGIAGAAQPFSIMNPYRVVMFIEPIPE